MVVNFRGKDINAAGVRVSGTRITATPDEINQALDGISADVTAANLSEVTGGEETDLHSHAASGGGVLVETIPLSSAALLALDTTRVTVVAGIADTVLIPIAAVLALKHGATPYAAENPVLLAVASRGPSSNERWLRSDVTDTLTASGYDPAVPLLPDVGALPDMTNATGGALVAYTDNPVTAGNGTATLTVWYSALTGIV